MKRLILTSFGIGSLALVLSSFSLAKVSDFNALIEENVSAQKELHGEIKKQMNTTTQALQNNRFDKANETVYVETDSEQINSPTTSRILKFKKEKSRNSVSQKKQMERVSQEFDEAESTY
ncbi:MAG: hypothetical protein ACK5V3_06930 [Bdellovibrionales bacterium]